MAADGLPLYMQVLAAAPIERAARHAAQQCRQLSALCRKLKTIEETVEMALMGITE